MAQDLGLLPRPSTDIVSAKSSKLNGKRIVLCVTGSVAAIESPRIARELIRHGAEVYSVMTSASRDFIHPNLMEWATGKPTVVELTGKMEHIWLTRGRSDKADLILIAPCTANTIGKIANGVDDTSVTTVVACALGSKIPIMIAPAMHESLYENALVFENIKKLKTRGVRFIEPVSQEEKAKMASTEDIVEEVLSDFSKKDLDSLGILVTAGPTREYIDPVRVITNKSSGKMGIALASEAVRRGGNVTLVCGPASIQAPRKIELAKVETTLEMCNAVNSALNTKSFDIIIMAGAPADFAPCERSERKLPSRGVSEYNLRLRPTPKILDIARDAVPSAFLVAFKAEPHLKEETIKKEVEILFKQAGVDMVVANDVSRTDIGFATDKNEVYVVMKSGQVLHIHKSTKSEVASKVLDIIIEALSMKRSSHR